jgi:hypothetical protein
MCDAVLACVPFTAYYQTVQGLHSFARCVSSQTPSVCRRFLIPRLKIENSETKQAGHQTRFCSRCKEKSLLFNHQLGRSCHLCHSARTTLLRSKRQCLAPAMSCVQGPCAVEEAEKAGPWDQMAHKTFPTLYRCILHSSA